MKHVKKSKRLVYTFKHSEISCPSIWQLCRTLVYFSRLLAVEVPSSSVFFFLLNFYCSKFKHWIQLILVSHQTTFVNQQLRNVISRNIFVDCEIILFQTLWSIQGTTKYYFLKLLFANSTTDCYSHRKSSHGSQTGNRCGSIWGLNSRNVKLYVFNSRQYFIMDDKNSISFVLTFTK